MKKNIVILIIIFLIIIGGIFIYRIFNPIGEPSKERMEIVQREVENYLIYQQSYKKEEIKSLKSHYNPIFGNADSAYSVDVVFVDEPDVEYQYGMIDNEVLQKGYGGSTDNPKHIEND